MNNEPSTNRFRLTDPQRDALALQLDTLPYDPNGSDEYVHSARAIAFSGLPREIVNVLWEQKASLRPRPYIIIENLPVDTFVHTTPLADAYYPTAKSGNRSENLTVGIASMLGEPYAIAFEGMDIVNNLIPTPEARQQYTGLGSDLELAYHIENAALKYMGDLNFSPQGLLLTGVRHDEHGPMTRISDSRPAIAELSEEDLETLRLPLYLIKLPYRWRAASPSGSLQTDPVPLIRGSKELPDVSAVFYPDMVEALTEKAATAMANFYQLIIKHGIAIDIKPGMAAYIDNRLALHSRDAFKPTYDTDSRPMRWVQRAFVAPNLWPHRNLDPVKTRVFQLPKEKEAC